MKYRMFDNMQVSEVGLGAWQFGGDFGDFEDPQAILRAAVDAGVTFFDTADVYGAGKSEEAIGRFLKGCSESIFVATKLGRFEGTGFPDAFTKESLTKATEASLKRLGVDALDLTQLHCISQEAMAGGEVWHWLGELKQAGKIKRFGASVESMEEALLCLEQEGLTSLQIIFNIFRQKPSKILFEKAAQKGVALIIRLPLASGLLAGKYTQATTFADTDHRNYNRNGECFNVGETFAGLPFEKGVALADQIKPLVPEGITMAQMAQRWILDHDAVTVMIPGARTVAHAASNAAVSESDSLSAELHSQLATLYENEVKAFIRGPY